MNFKTGWHILYVKPHWEKKVNESLQDISLESFLPLVKKIRQWSDRKKTITSPLFASYVFININSPLDFHKSLSVDGICTYVKIGNDYATIREKEINQIKLLVGDNKIKDIHTNTSLPNIGTIQKIIYGPLKGLECEILKIDNLNKIVVRIASLRQDITATLPNEYLTTFSKTV